MTQVGAETMLLGWRGSCESLQPKPAKLWGLPQIFLDNNYAQTLGMQASSFDDPIKGTNLRTRNPKPSFCPKIYSFLPMFLLDKSSITGSPRQGLNHGFHQLLGGRGGI